MPASLATILAKMKKRQAEAPADAPKAKKVYTGNLRIDLHATVISAYNTEKSERFTVVVSTNGVDKMEKNPRSNGYYEDGVIKVRPQNSEDYTETIVPGDVFECSRWHGGKPEKFPKTFKFGDSAVLKRVSIKKGDNGMNFNNVHWVEHSKEQFPMTIPKSMSDLESEGYHKAVVLGPDSDVTGEFGQLKLTSSGKIYTRFTFLYGEEGDIEGSAMFWQETLFKFGIYNPETLESILPKVLETSFTIIGNKEKEKEGYESTSLKLNIRALLLGAGTLQQYIEEYGVHMTKAKVVKAIGATVNCDLNEGHPLNSDPDTKVLNLNEWSGNVKEMPAPTKFYKLFDTVLFAVLA
jgi:hypothetical protein